MLKNLNYRFNCRVDLDVQSLDLVNQCKRFHVFFKTLRCPPNVVFKFVSNHSDKNVRHSAGEIDTDPSKRQTEIGALA